MQQSSRGRPALLAALAVLLVLAASAPAATAQAPSLQLVTPYPAVSVEAGKSVTFNLEVRTSTRQRVSLEVFEVPPGWQATLRGGGFVVHGVFGAPDDAPQVQLDVRVPPDAAKGDFRVPVRASAGNLSDTLNLDIRVAEVGGGAVTLTAEFPSLRGAATSSLRYNMTLANNTPESLTFNLSAEAPPGWDVQVRPTAQTQAATVKVDGGGTAGIEVEADPPDDAAADKYEIKVRAASGSQTAETAVTAEITGTAKMTLTTPNERLNAEAVAGKASTLELVVKNDGTTPLRDVRLSGSPPSGWKVTFRPASIQEVAPKKSAKMTAVITPSGEAVAGDYVVTLSASGQGASDDADIRVTVETSRLFGFVGLLVIGAAVYALYFVFRRYGRR